MVLFWFLAPASVTTLTNDSKTDRSILLSWSEPENTGGLPISQYKVEKNISCPAVYLPVNTLLICWLEMNLVMKVWFSSSSNQQIPLAVYSAGCLFARNASEKLNILVPMSENHNVMGGPIPYRASHYIMSFRLCTLLHTHATCTSVTIVMLDMFVFPWLTEIQWLNSYIT